MFHGFARRVEWLEDALVIGEERHEFERQRRFNYNLLSVSDDALHASIKAMEQRKPTPDWAETEIQKPNRPDAHPCLVREVERKTRNEMTLSRRCTVA